MTRGQKWKYGLIGAALPTVIVIVLVSVAAVVVNFVSEMGPNDISRKTEHYAQLAEYAPENATVFFGDSITELCSVEDIYAEYSEKSGSPVINRGISAETTDHMLERVEESVIALKPRNVVMLMGVNDLSAGVSQEKITNNIRQMIQLIKEKSPETNIVLQAVYPTGGERESLYENYQLGGRDSATVKALNEKLAAMAAEEKVRFLDVTNILADENGNLRNDYTYDGLHPNVSGYLAVRDAIVSELV